ncbi:Fe(3+)-hydroxamate ABC transporter permease FhuB [Psychrobacter sp. CCUG 69069]|uniref:Fe(3+)-hydroxamate ABC transporter permease FhuB n=1 Tax=Psychrobacter namhaensis TaxID=292734 RepID=A0ABW8L5E8_9GAMM|nr:Fe(3+)-hydroxamate ABC transporter permease FhuB [Psychrobacter sp. CCUG 69069]MCD1279068.1 Fe(3+)-hydroxamate ABC transporter permease FhuB [Psychrobacter sp. CCUG 69069]
MNTHIDNHPQHLNANNTNNNANPMTSLSTSQSVELSKQSPKMRQQSYVPPPTPPQQQNVSLFINSWRLWVMVTTLILLSLWSSWALIAQEWTRPLSELFLPSSQLDIASMATQLHLVATSIVALLAGGLLGVVSILLQQLVKNPLASDTTLGVGVGAQLAMLIVTLFLPSLAIYGGVYVAFVGAVISMGLVFALSAPSRFNPLILILAGLVVNILLAAVANVLVLFFAERSNGMLSWAAGFLAQNSWSTSVMLAITTIAMTAVCLPLLKPLTLMSLDDMQAKRLGVPINGIRATVVLIVAIVTALVVSEVGLIGFIGLGAASLVNALGVSSINKRLVAAFGLGALLLWLTSNVALLLEPILSMQIPAGAMTGILGAPLIIWLILRQRRERIETVIPTLTGKNMPVAYWRWGLGVVVMIVLACLFVQDVNGWGLSTDWAITEQYRLPRSLSAAATGLMLAVAGVLLQTLTRNPMASPEVLGVSSGAALGVILGFLLLPSLGITAGAGTLLMSGLSGAIAVLLLIIWLARRVSSGYLLLVGIGIAAMMDGVMHMVKLSGDPRLEAMLSWLSGTTYSAQPSTVWYLIGIALVLFALSLLFIKPLRVLGLGTGVARTLGVAVTPVTIALLALVAALSTASTLAVGPLSFIGLMVPHLATSLGAVRLERQLPLAALLGAGVMVLADWVGRYVIFPYELPAGTIAAIIGGAYFLWLIRKVPVAVSR